MKKNAKKIILYSVLAVVLLIVAFVGFLAHIGFEGRGPLLFLSYFESPVQLTAKQYEYTEMPFTVKNQSENLVGTMYVPQDNRMRRKVLIYSPGFSCPGTWLSNKAKSLAAAGTATVIFDFRGGSHLAKSEGQTKRMTYSTEMSDLCRVIEHVKSQQWADTTGIYLMGESFGGLVSALTASRRSDIAGLILWFPAFHSAESACNYFPTTEAIPDSLQVGEMLTGKAFWQSLLALDVYREIPRYTGRVLIIHGTDDQQVNPEYSVRANRLYKHSELVLLEGGDHGFGGNNAKSALKTVLHFINDK